MNQRGGLVVKAGDVGRVNCLRQQILAPGERLSGRIAGSVRMETLRERDYFRIHAHLGIFATPIRWLWSSWPSYVLEGPSTSRRLPTETGTSPLAVGIGSQSSDRFSIVNFWRLAYDRVWNEWYKFGEDADKSISSVSGLDQGYGLPAVPLQCVWSRIRASKSPSGDDRDVSVSSNKFSVEDLAEAQARYKSEMRRDVLTFDRYMEALKTLYGREGSREVDKVPMMISEAEIGVDPREMPATDGASLGQWQSIYDFQIDHRWDFVAPEHMIIGYYLTVRFAPIVEDERSPFATGLGMNQQEFVGDPVVLQSTAPVNFAFQEVFGDGSSSNIGFKPAGWQWREGFNIYDERFSDRGSFPIMDNPTTLANTRDATRTDNAFRSESFRDMVCHLYFTESSHRAFPDAMESYTLGQYGGSGGSEYPHQGKMK